MILEFGIPKGFFLSHILFLLLHIETVNYTVNKKKTYLGRKNKLVYIILYNLSYYLKGKNGLWLYIYI